MQAWLKKLATSEEKKLAAHLAKGDGAYAVFAQPSRPTNPDKLQAVMKKKKATYQQVVQDALHRFEIVRCAGCQGKYPELCSILTSKAGLLKSVFDGLPRRLLSLVVPPQLF